jgi:hypothetical protein
MKFHGLRLQLISTSESWLGENGLLALIGLKTHLTWDRSLNSDRFIKIFLYIFLQFFPKNVNYQEMITQKW